MLRSLPLSLFLHANVLCSPPQDWPTLDKKELELPTVEDSQRQAYEEVSGSSSFRLLLSRSAMTSFKYTFINPLHHSPSSSLSLPTFLTLLLSFASTSASARKLKIKQNKIDFTPKVLKMLIFFSHEILLSWELKSGGTEINGNTQN